MRNSLFNITFALNCLLIFLLLFETRLDIPAWLQVAGRTHPVFLHFPLVLVLAYGVMAFIFAFKKSIDNSYRVIGSWVLLLAAFSAALAALAGLILSREEGYDAEALQWHKWSGAAVSVLTLGWYYFHSRMETAKFASAFTAFIAIFLVIFTT